jgi:hypothetical protein
MIPAKYFSPPKGALKIGTNTQIPTQKAQLTLPKHDKRNERAEKNRVTPTQTMIQ